MPRTPYKMGAGFARELVAFATGPHAAGANFYANGSGSSLGEYEVYYGTATSGRAVCLACGERLPAGEPVLVVAWLVGAGYNQWNERQLHASPCLPVEGATL